MRSWRGDFLRIWEGAKGASDELVFLHSVDIRDSILEAFMGKKSLAKLGFSSLQFGHLGFFQPVDIKPWSLQKSHAFFMQPTTTIGEALVLACLSSL